MVDGSIPSTPTKLTFISKYAIFNKMNHGHSGFPTHEHAQTPDDLTRNLNDMVRIKVTENGERAWTQAHADVVAAFPTHADDYKLARDNDGCTTMQLHDVMRVFGPAMPDGMGSPIETSFSFVEPS